MSNMRNGLHNGHRHRRRLGLAGIMTLATVLAACGAAESAGQAGTAEEGAQGGEPTTVVMQLPWFPQPAHGAVFGAKVGGFYEDAGLQVKIKSGGARTSEAQIVAAGEAQFSLTISDDLIEAQAQGLPLVAVAANLQTSPVALMFREGAGISKPQDISGRTVYVVPAANYWLYIKEKYNIDPGKVVSFQGSLAPFLANPGSVTQGYVTTNLYTLEQEKGIPIDYFSIVDLGYNPYPVFFTSEQMIQSKPEVVKAFVQATMKGWEYYFDHMNEVNQAIRKRNEHLSAEKVAYAGKKLHDLVYTAVTEQHGLGYMTAQHWKNLVDAMKTINKLDNPVQVDELYTNEFLPQSS